MLDGRIFEDLYFPEWKRFSSICTVFSLFKWLNVWDLLSCRVYLIIHDLLNASNHYFCNKWFFQRQVSLNKSLKEFLCTNKTNTSKMEVFLIDFQWFSPFFSSISSIKKFSIFSHSISIYLHILFSIFPWIVQLSFSLSKNIPSKILKE